MQRQFQKMGFTSFGSALQYVSEPVQIRLSAVHAFTAHQCADFTGLGARGGGEHNAPLVGIGNVATFGNGHDFGINAG